MKKVLVLAFAAVMAVSMLAGCGQTANDSSKDNAGSKPASTTTTTTADKATTETTDKTTDAAESTPLKDRADDAKKEIEAAMQQQLNEAYSDKITEAKIVDVKVYSTEQEQADELLKSLKLSEDEVAFEVKYEMKPAEGVDVNEFLAGTGDYDEESGWIVEKYNVGVLEPNASGDPAYVVTHFGTGF